MYRETVLGAALASALEEASEQLAVRTADEGSTGGSANHALEQGQPLSGALRAAVWSAFDEAMSEALQELPASSALLVSMPPPSAPHQQSSNALPLDDHAEDQDQQLSHVVAPNSTQYPLFRCIDGEWTIILRDPSVQVRTGGGASSKGGGAKHTRTFKLDYLKIVAKSHSTQSGTAAAAGSSTRSSSGAKRKAARKKK